MNILADIQKRIPDRLFFRHLLPSLFYVSVAALGSALGQADWNDVAAARRAVTHLLKLGSADTASALILLVVAAAGVAAAIAVAASFVGALAAGDRRWWGPRQDAWPGSSQPGIR
jgi:hypothetical protein